MSLRRRVHLRKRATDCPACARAGLTLCRCASPLQRTARLGPNRERVKRLREVQFGSKRAWIVMQPCAVPGCDGRPPYVQPHHAKTRAAGGKSAHMIPLCAGHHREWHDIGPLSWQRKHGLDADALAVAFEREWQGVAA